MPSNLPRGLSASQKCFFKVMGVDSSSLLPGSEFRDAPSDHVCKPESVKPFFSTVFDEDKLQFQYRSKKISVCPNPQSWHPQFPWAPVLPAKPPPWHPGGGRDPRSWHRGAWSLWELDVTGGKWQPQLGWPVHREILCRVINAPPPLPK